MQLLHISKFFVWTYRSVFCDSFRKDLLSQTKDMCHGICLEDSNELEKKILLVLGSTGKSTEKKLGKFSWSSLSLKTKSQAFLSKRIWSPGRAFAGKDGRISTSSVQLRCLWRQAVWKLSWCLLFLSLCVNMNTGQVSLIYAIHRNCLESPKVPQNQFPWESGVFIHPTSQV